VRSVLFALVVVFSSFSSVSANADDAAMFGARETVIDISLSPDGTRIAYIEPGSGQSSSLYVSAIGDKAVPKKISGSDGAPWKISWCSWASNSRLVCKLYGLVNTGNGLISFTRLLAINADGTEVKSLGQRQTARSLGASQFDGDVIGWSTSDDGSVLMSREYVPEFSTGTNISSSAKGLGVDRVNTLTLKSSREAPANARAESYLADTNGVVRIMELAQQRSDGVLTGKRSYLYRLVDGKTWKPFSESDGETPFYRPYAVDGITNTAYAYAKKDGRDALYKVALDGSLTATLMLENAKVDVDRLLTFGRTGRVFGAEIVTDKREAIIFDPVYKALAARLGKALSGFPLVSFVDASRDEKKLLLFAGSDVDPGRYYVFDRTTKSLSEIMLARPQLEGKPLAPVKSITFKAADGTMIPGYLTLPVGSSGKGLPALVMPHGGPSSRDEWGFDWLAQYFASQGFAVLQPNFRGSAGYGDNWYAENGFKSWRLSVGDVNDSARWLVSQGIADPAKLAAYGWSYGGYAALQSGVLDPELFKAVVAIAPVTDLRMLIDDSKGFTNASIVADFVGSGEHIVSGSPLRNIGKLKAPVMMFTGDMDVNVNYNHAKAMDAALQNAKKSSRLIVYKGLDHQIDDSAQRADMLAKSLAFLKASLKM
jgi:dienelactone hydrolase